MGGGAHRVVYYWHMLGNRFLTTLSNMTTNLNLTDMECCYISSFDVRSWSKLPCRRTVLGSSLRLTAKVARLKFGSMVGISYYGRTYDEERKSVGRMASAQSM